MLTEIVNQILSIGAILVQVIFLVGFVYLIFLKPGKYPPLSSFLKKWGLFLAFLIALAAVSGSLFYSEIAGFAPCDLCWFQRIFMYPQVIILGIAIWKKDLGAIKYSLPLAIGGLIVALYHNYITYSGSAISVCSRSTFIGVSCLQRYVFEFGYITIPLMSLSAFALIALILFLIKKQAK